MVTAKQVAYHYQLDRKRLSGQPVIRNLSDAQKIARDLAYKQIAQNVLALNKSVTAKLGQKAFDLSDDVSKLVQNPAYMALTPEEKAFAMAAKEAEERLMNSKEFAAARAKIAGSMQKRKAQIASGARALVQHHMEIAMMEREIHLLRMKGFAAFHRLGENFKRFSSKKSFVKTGRRVASFFGVVSSLVVISGIQQFMVAPDNVSVIDEEAKAAQAELAAAYARWEAIIAVVSTSEARLKGAEKIEQEFQEILSAPEETSSSVEPTQEVVPTEEVIS